MYILYCRACGKMFKAQKMENFYLTDFGDKIVECACGHNLEEMKTDDWVADMVFTIKGK